MSSIVTYLVAYAEAHAAPIRFGVEVSELRQATRGGDFVAKTPAGAVEADNVIVAARRFRRPVLPESATRDRGVTRMHSSRYCNLPQLPEGAARVIGANTSDAQITEELRAGRSVLLSVGPHDRPPRRYRGRDFVWWFGALGHWDAWTTSPSARHVTIAVSGTLVREAASIRSVTTFENKGNFPLSLGRASSSLAINLVDWRAR